VRAARPAFDEIVHAPNRLQICAMLAAVDTVEFATVRDSLGVADSVVSKHVRVLQEAGYVAIRKATVGSRVRTSLSLTASGHRAYAGHVAALRALVDVHPAGKVHRASGEARR
jgi:DNA-binding MarR family transcriptional regulator